MEDLLQEAFGKEIRYVTENGKEDYIQNISDFTDEEVEYIDLYNTTRNNIISDDGHIKKDILDFLYSHPELEHIYLFLEDQEKRDLIELDDVDLLNLADKYGFND